MDQYNTAQSNKMQYSTRLTQRYLLKPMTLQSEVEDFFKILQIIYMCSVRLLLPTAIIRIFMMTVWPGVVLKVRGIQGEQECWQHNSLRSSCTAQHHIRLSTASLTYCGLSVRCSVIHEDMFTDISCSFALNRSGWMMLNAFEKSKQVILTLNQCISQLSHYFWVSEN